ncbi:M15 family metallopeptidase [Candidatus Coxiella mudrowiae]|uniref:M15 family metallopeptidase n=1 Tax=Candidatus Coxiella mudrowiae TaxID=2054173 RepID=UPI000662C396|nr:DUF6682 family protein [Candidatus Coxiella mudrowiae]
MLYDLKRKHLIPLNSYRNEGRKGMQDYILTRRSVLEQLQIVAKQLAPHYSLLLFDTYRSLETQVDIFNFMCETVRKQYPDWRKENIEQETRKYAAHPNDPSQFAISPHNSGGAVDLAIGHSHSGEVWAFGTEFDEVSELSRTDFFENE